MTNTMKKYLLTVSSLYFLFSGTSTFAQNFDQQLQEKNRQLQEIQRQLQETQQNISDTTERGRGLQRDVQRLQKEIGQLRLGIKLNETTIGKLGLEISSLQVGVQNAEQKITSKKEALARLLRRLQEKNNESLVIKLFRTNSLSASVAEAMNISVLNDELGDHINELEGLQEDLSDKLTQTTKRKNAKEVEAKNLKVRQAAVAEREKERKELLQQTNQQKKAYEKQLSELERQQLAIAEEVEALERQLRADIDPNSLPASRPGVLGMPVAAGRLSQAWGATKFARYNYKGKWHNGNDFPSFIGTPILAAEDGVVLAVGDQDQYCRRGAYGKYIVIKHLNNLTTLYAHLSGFNTSVGAVVRRGDVIGFMGRTGYSTGSHLHFTVYDGKTFAMRTSVMCGAMPSGGDLNPQKYL